MYLRRCALIGVLSFVCCGCGGGNSSPGTIPFEFSIVSGNWNIQLPGSFPFPTAGGLLTQSGNTISGILHVNGSPCFDPIADELIVSGTGSDDNSYTVTLRTAPLRGQVITVNASWDAASNIIPQFAPTGPVGVLAGDVTLSGGSCAGEVSGTRLQLLSLQGSWTGSAKGTNWSGNLTAQLTQSQPDALGFSHVTGTFSFANSPCFTSGTVASSSVAGDTTQMVINTDSGSLIGTGTEDHPADGLNQAFTSFNFPMTVQGGTCSGQSVLLHFGT